jgi:hypothetical protein
LFLFLFSALVLELLHSVSLLPRRGLATDAKIRRSKPIQLIRDVSSSLFSRRKEITKRTRVVGGKMRERKDPSGRCFPFSSNHSKNFLPTSHQTPFFPYLTVHLLSSSPPPPPPSSSSSSFSLLKS